MNGDASRLRSASGNALVEFAVALPMLVLIVVGTIDFGRVFYHAIEVTEAARAGSQKGAEGTGVSAGDMQTAAAAAGADIGLTTANIAASQMCQCANDNATSLPAPTTGACTATCSSGQHKVYFATVTATKVFTMFAYYPPLPHTITITRTAWQRIQ